MNPVNPCGEVPGGKAFEMAVTAAELGLDVVNMFIIVSAAFAGWLLAEKTAISTPRGSGLRICLALGYTASAGSLGFGAVYLFQRGTAALNFAKETAEGCGHADGSWLAQLYSSGGGWAAPVSIVVTMMAVLWIILFISPAVKDDNSSNLLGG